MVKTIWIGADYPFSGAPWEVFTAGVEFKPNTRAIAMITADRIPPNAECVYSDDDCAIYRFVGIMFQVDKSTKEITVSQS